MQPLPANQTSTDMLNDFNKLNAMLAAKGMALPPDWTTMPPEQKQEFLKQVGNDAHQTQQISQKVQDFASEQEAHTQDMQMQGLPPMTPAMAKGRAFNLKKQAQMGPPMADPMAMPSD